MSYDLFLVPRAGKLDKKAFTTFFKRRPCYQLGGGQAVYQNEDTGVYFLFDEPQDGVVAFNLNYFRPHTFGLEAALELEAACKALNTLIADDSGNQGPFDKATFLKTWNEGNQFGYRAMLKDGQKPHLWPARRIREIWDWNYARRDDQEGVRDGMFVPGIFAIDQKGPRSVAIWPPECPILLPRVDVVLVPLAQTGKASEQLALVPWSEVAPIAELRAAKAPGIARYALQFEPWPADIQAFLNKKRPASTDFEGIPHDQILDEELAAAARK